MRVKVQEDGTCVAVDIEYNHNHQLMQTDDVKHTTIMSMLSENEDGSYFLSMTGRDLLNQ